MAIILDVQTAGTTRRIVMRNGQVATFGTDVWTDFSFPMESGLAGRHFRLDCRNDRCEMVVLEDRKDVFHNEMPVGSAQLRSGDRLSIGATRIHIRFGGLESNWSNETPSTEPPRFTMTTAESCRGVELPSDVAAIVNSHPVPPECLDALVAAGHLTPAIRVLAAVLPSRAAIWWLFSVLRRPAESHSYPMDGPLQTEIEAWIVEPTEGRRRAIETQIQQGDRKSPTIWLGWAVFWAGPSLAPPGVGAVPPPGHLVGTAVTTAAVLIAAQTPSAMPAALERILLSGREVLDGKRPWPSTARPSEMA